MDSPCPRQAGQCHRTSKAQKGERFFLPINVPCLGDLGRPGLDAAVEEMPPSSANMFSRELSVAWEE